MLGKIEKIEDTSSDRFKQVTINGKKYGIESKLLNDFKVGDQVEHNIEPKGKFKNIIEIKPHIVSLEERIITKVSPVQVMGDTLNEVSGMYQKLPLDLEMKKSIDWTKIVISLFIAKTNGRGE